MSTAKLPASRSGSLCVGDKYGELSRRGASASRIFPTRRKRRAKSIMVYGKSPLQNWDLGASGPRRGRDAGRWLRWQIKLELFEQQLLVGIELGIAAEDQSAPVGCREMHVEHLHCGHLVEHRS